MCLGGLAMTPATNQVQQVSDQMQSGAGPQQAPDPKLSRADAARILLGRNK